MKKNLPNTSDYLHILNYIQYPGRFSQAVSSVIPLKQPAPLGSSFLKTLLLLVAFFGYLQAGLAQTTTITTETGTNFTGGNGQSNDPAAITFVIENTNAYAIILTGVDVYWRTDNTGGIPSLWYSTSSLAGVPTVVAGAWSSLISAPALSIPTNGYYPTFTNLSFIIPAGGVYRFAVSSTKGIRYSGTGSNPVPSPSTLTGGGVNLKVYDATVVGSSGSVGYGGLLPDLTYGPRAFTGRIHFQQATPCTAPPTAGQAISNLSTVCAKANFVLNLSGATTGTGLTYQWQSSPNGSAWTDIAGATGSTYSATQNVTTHYRAQVTCSGQTTASGSVQVTTTPTPAILTIDKNAPASATNFTSITAALQSLTGCGVSGGPIELSVVPNSGPYNEQVVITPIPGASATSMVILKGNGNTITASPGTTNLGVFTLDGADFIRIDSFTIALNQGATTGWGIQLKNAANNNIISGNTVNMPINTNSPDINGIVAGLAVTGTGSISQGNNTNNSIIRNNDINGGYYGIRINGNNGGVDAVGNQVLGNNIKDSFRANVSVYNTESNLIEGNDISCPARSASLGFTGIEISFNNKKLVISKNRIHNSHGGAPSSGHSAVGISSTGDNTPVNATIIKNNLIYNLGGNGTGTVTGIYNSDSNGNYYYHNTIDFRKVTTGDVRGFYYSGFGATNIRFFNNVVRVDAGFTGNKYAINIADINGDVTSDYNVLVVNQATGNHYIGRFGGQLSGTNQFNLADWQAVNSRAFDQNSLEIDPTFTNAAAGDFTPNNIILLNYGLPLVPPITEDFYGTTRSTTTPTPGAIEFFRPTGLKENYPQLQVNVYPNPGNGTFNVDLPKGKAFDLTVTDLTGRVISKKTATSGLSKLELSHLSKGVYLLRIKGETGTAARKLIIE